MRCYPLLATYCRHCGNARLLQAPRNESQEFSCFGLSYSWFMRLLRPVQQEISERNLRSMVHEVLAQVHSQRFSTLTFTWHISKLLLIYRRCTGTEPDKTLGDDHKLVIYHFFLPHLIIPYCFPEFNFAFLLARFCQ